MKSHRVHVAALCVLLAVSAATCVRVPQAATLNVHCTAPAASNDGSCGARLLAALPLSTSVVVHFAWTGPASGQDSVVTFPGGPVSLSRTVPAGLYAVRAWASDSGGVSCDTTVTVAAKVPPAPVLMLP